MRKINSCLIYCRSGFLLFALGFFCVVIVGCVSWFLFTSGVECSFRFFFSVLYCLGRRIVFGILGGRSFFYREG